MSVVKRYVIIVIKVKKSLIGNIFCLKIFNILGEVRFILVKNKKYKIIVIDIKILFGFMLFS